MKKASVLFISVFLFIVFANAQENTAKQPCFRVSSFSSSLGFGGSLTSNTDADYYLLQNAVDNPQQFVDITGMKNSGPSWGFKGMGYYNGMSYNSGGSGNGNLLFNLGLTPYSKKLGKYRENRELRFSVGGSMGSRNQFHYYENNSFVIDTLYSVNGNNTVYADSVNNKQYNYSLNFSEINFGASYLFKTDVKRRVNFYAGIGFNYGISLRSYISFNEETYSALRYYNENDKPSDDEIYYGSYNTISSYSSSTNNLKNPMQFLRVFIPVGLNFTLSKKPESFCSHVDLYTEMSPGVEFQILSSEKTYTNPYFGVAVIGFRYKW
jgi:hypothetical protein